MNRQMYLRLFVFLAIVVIAGSQHLSLHHLFNPHSAHHGQPAHHGSHHQPAHHGGHQQGHHGGHHELHHGYGGTHSSWHASIVRHAFGK
uniref:Histidine-rich glycoprotein n=1 Tax=Panagrellus redivivus TaxID=6233 RepID=A0A7E4VQW3_PANRE